MLARRRTIVQKSFRIDYEYERDLNLLSKAVNRSQTDLVNAALSEFLSDNRIHFLRTAVMEHFLEQFENAEQYEPFEMGGLKVAFIPSFVGKQLQVTYESNAATGSYTWDGKNIDELCDCLIKLSDCIDPNAEDVQKYLDDHVDYRDFVKVKRSEVICNE